jgi:hypothetical protein
MITLKMAPGLDSSLKAKEVAEFNQKFDAANTKLTYEAPPTRPSRSRWMRRRQRFRRSDRKKIRNPKLEIRSKSEIPNFETLAQLLR